MTEKMLVKTYDVDHENQVRWTAHLDRKTVILTIEANGHGVQIKLPPEVAAELAVNLAQRPDHGGRQGPVSRRPFQQGRVRRCDFRDDPLRRAQGDADADGLERQAHQRDAAFAARARRLGIDGGETDRRDHAGDRGQRQRLRRPPPGRDRRSSCPRSRRMSWPSATRCTGTAVRRHSSLTTAPRATSRQATPPRRPATASRWSSAVSRRTPRKRHRPAYPWPARGPPGHTKLSSSSAGR